MRIRVLAFAHLRELLKSADMPLNLELGASAADAWEALERQQPGLRAARSSTRFARNGTLVTPSEALQDGDELALLPPVGGG